MGVSSKRSTRNPTTRAARINQNMRSIDISHVFDGNMQIRVLDTQIDLNACVHVCSILPHTPMQTYDCCAVQSDVRSTAPEHANTTSMTIVFYANPSQGDNGQRVPVAAAVLCLVSWLYTRVLAYMRSMHAYATGTCSCPSPSCSPRDRSLGFRRQAVKTHEHKQKPKRLKT